MDHCTFDGTGVQTKLPKHDKTTPNIFRKDYKPEEICVPPSELFDDHTTYRDTFMWVYLLKRDNFKPEEVVFRTKMPFPDTTCYKTQFPKYDVEPHKDYIPKEVYMPPDEPF